MTHSDLDPDLARLGDALRAGATVNLAQEQQTARAGRAEPTRARFLRRPRIFAGSSLGLAGAGAVALLALSGTAATAPAYAITKKSDGTILVHLNFVGPRTYMDLDKELTAKYHEEILVSTAAGAATSTQPLDCVVTRVPGVQAPSGPAIRVLLGKDGTEVLPSGTTGAGPVHLTSCGLYYNSGVRGADGTGNTGNS